MFQYIISKKKFYNKLISLNKLIWKLRIIIWEIEWFFNFKKNKPVTNNRPIYSIGVVTYVDRYEMFFKPLIKKLTKSFPNVEINVCINGFHDRNLQQNYLNEVSKFLSQFQNIKIIKFIEPQGLSKLWNLLIKNSEATKVLILNDDLIIRKSFSNNLYKSDILFQDFSLINRSWSHFLISKKIFDHIGDFDENFLGVGNEDEDYETRLIFSGYVIHNKKLKGIRNVSYPTRNFSYSKNMEISNKKYSSVNSIYFDKKWQKSLTPKEGFKFVEILNCFIAPHKGNRC